MNEASPRRGCRRPVFWILGAVLIGVPLSGQVIWDVFTGAKLSGRVTICQSNLKQISTALMMYTYDYDERFPPAAYVEGTHSVAVPALLAFYLKNDRVWECPTDLKNGIKNRTFDGNRDDITVSYGYNGRSLAPGGKGVKRSQVKQPANTIAFVESDSHLVAPAGLVAALGGTPPAYRHPAEGGPPRLNVAWVDGHATTLVPGKLEEVITQESGKRVGPGIDAFHYWNLR
jgi:prepilin-type processing-associated H-X9-DG protein